MKNWYIGAIAGGLAGVVGALLMDKDYSLLTVVVLGAIIGFLVGKFSKRRR